MSFLAPLFLLGTLTVALPFIFHLIRRSTRERVPFSSLMFLLPTPPRVTRRSRLENILLLVLRCLVIALLALGFARPFFSRPMTPDLTGANGQKTLVLVDASASMRRGALWTEAKDKARSVLRAAALSDQVACYTFDDGLHALTTFDAWSSAPVSDRKALAEKQLDEAKLSWSSTRLGNALVSACELFESPGKEDPRPKHIVLITDLQAGSRLDGLQGFEWPRGIDVRVESLNTRGTSNAGLQLASDAPEPDKPNAEVATRVRVTNASDSQRDQFQVGWSEGAEKKWLGPTVDIYVPPGQSRVIAVPRTDQSMGADRLVLAGDDETFDNTVFVIPSKAHRSQILFLGSTAEQGTASPFFYLERAFQQTRQLAVEVISRPLGTRLSEAEVSGSRLLVIYSALSEEQLAQVKQSLGMGHGALLVVADAAMSPVINRLTGQDVTAEEATGPYAMLADIRFDHPLFAPFADPRYSDFTKIHFWRHRRLSFPAEAKAQVLARFDNGDPALTELSAGPGKLWILSSGWQLADSQLALSSKFVPLLYAMLEQSGGIPEARSQYFVGESVPLVTDLPSVTIRAPDASELKVARGEKFTRTEEPGVYRIGAPESSASFAVNLAPEESRTAVLGPEELERLGVPLQPQSGPSLQQTRQHQEHLQAIQLESRQKLWRWLLVAALVILVMETWLAGRLTRRTRSVPAQPA